MIGALLLLLCGLCGTASTQTTYGLIEGRITDATGGALPGATITVTQPTTGFVRTVVTNELGLYRVLNLNPAEYDVTVEMTGFAKVTYGSVKIDVGQAVALNVGMEVAKVAVVMDVAPPMPTVNAVTPEISNTIDTRRVNEVPNANVLAPVTFGSMRRKEPVLIGQDRKVPCSEATTSEESRLLALLLALVFLRSRLRNRSRSQARRAPPY